FRIMHGGGLEVRKCQAEENSSYCYRARTGYVIRPDARRSETAYVFSANGAALFAAWGNAPGTRPPTHCLALKARFIPTQFCVIVFHTPRGISRVVAQTWN